MIELRWIETDAGPNGWSQPPRLQYRQLVQRLAPGVRIEADDEAFADVADLLSKAMQEDRWGEWTDVPTVVVPSAAQPKIRAEDLAHLRVEAQREDAR